MNPVWHAVDLLLVLVLSYPVFAITGFFWQAQRSGKNGALGALMWLFIALSIVVILMGGAIDVLLLLGWVDDRALMLRAFIGRTGLAVAFFWLWFVLLVRKS